LLLLLLGKTITSIAIIMKILLLAASTSPHIIKWGRSLAQQGCTILIARRQWVQEQYVWEQNIQQMLEEYHRIIAKQRAQV